MIILSAISWSDFFFHIRLFINGTLTGILFGILIYRNVVLKWDTKRRLW